MGTCFFGLAVVFFFIGVIQLFSPDRSRSGAQRSPFENLPWMPGSRPDAGASRSFPGASPQNVPRPTAFDPRTPASPAQTEMGGETVQSGLEKLNWVQLGQRIQVGHPVKGQLMAHVLGIIRYAELWQTSRGAQSPWVPTGNSYLGFWLEGGSFLLHWQNRFYYLEEAVPLSDSDIRTHFMPHAQKFAQSDQTADVYFAYPPASWHIDDIGKFRVVDTQGEGLRFQPGAVGRFIHASGDSERALVVEDYEGGGQGQDTAWVGYLVKEETIQEA